MKGHTVIWRTTLTALVIAAALTGCSSVDKDADKSVCGLSPSHLHAAFGDAALSQAKWLGAWPVGPDNDNGYVTCSAAIEDELSLIITSQLVSTDEVDERARIIAKFDHHIDVAGLPVSYAEDERGFEAQAACGMILTVVTGPTVDGVDAAEREALIRDVVQTAGCERLPGVAALPPALKGVAQ